MPLLRKPSAEQNTDQVTDHATDQAIVQASGQVPEEVRLWMLILKGEMKRAVMQKFHPQKSLPAEQKRQWFTVER